MYYLAVVLFYRMRVELSASEGAALLCLAPSADL